MKKFKAIALLLAAVLALSCMGCGNSTQEINGFQKASYKKYSSDTAEENLKGTLIYVDGVVDSRTISKDEVTGKDILSMLVKKGKDCWVLSAPGDSLIGDIEGENVRAFGTYQGKSNQFDAPVLEIAVDDEMYLPYARLDLNSEGNYQTVWKYSDYLEQLEVLIAGRKVLAEEMYEFDGKPVSIRLVEEDESASAALVFSATVADEKVVPFFTYQIYWSYTLMNLFNKLEKTVDRLDLLLHYADSDKSEFYSGTNNFNVKVRLNGQDSSEEMQSIGLDSTYVSNLTEEEAYHTTTQINEMLEKARILVAETEYPAEMLLSKKNGVRIQNSYEFDGGTVDVALVKDKGDISVYVTSLSDDTDKTSLYIAMMYSWFEIYNENTDEPLKYLGLFVSSDYPHRAVSCLGEDWSSLRIIGFNKDRSPSESGAFPDWFDENNMNMSEEEQKDYLNKVLELATDMQLWIYGEVLLLQ